MNHRRRFYDYYPPVQKFLMILEIALESLLYHWMIWAAESQSNTSQRYKEREWCQIVFNRCLNWGPNLQKNQKILFWCLYQFHKANVQCDEYDNDDDDDDDFFLLFKER